MALSDSKRLRQLIGSPTTTPARLKKTLTKGKDGNHRSAMARKRRGGWAPKRQEMPTTRPSKGNWPEWLGTINTRPGGTFSIPVIWGRK